MPDLKTSDEDPWTDFDGTEQFRLSRAGASKRGLALDMRKFFKATPYADIVYHGARGDGSFNNAAAFQSAHDSLPADGGVIYVRGTYAHYPVNSPVVFTKPVKLLGDGWYGSEITSTTAGLVLFSSTAILAVEDMDFIGLGAAANTCVMIQHEAGASGHGGSTFRASRFRQALHGYRAYSANAPNFHNCYFADFGVSGLWLQNNTNSDIGDGAISNCTFAAAGGVGIRVHSMSGMNLVNNKFNAAAGHVLIDVGANPVGNFLFANNSFEGHANYAIRTQTSGGVITKFLSTGNQYSSNGATHLDLLGNVQNSLISGNIFNDGNPANGTAIRVGSGSVNTNITGNSFHQIQNAIVTANGGVPRGINVSGNRFAADVTNIFSGDVGLNSLTGLKEIDVTASVLVTSDTVYTNFVAVKGNCTIEVVIEGLVQGVGACNYFCKKLLSGSAAVNIVAPVVSGAAFDVGYTVSGSELLIGVKRAAGIGSSVTTNLTVRVYGAPETVRRV